MKPDRLVARVAAESGKPAGRRRAARALIGEVVLRDVVFYLTCVTAALGLAAVGLPALVLVGRVSSSVPLWLTVLVLLLLAIWVWRARRVLRARLLRAPDVRAGSAPDAAEGR